MKTINLEDYGRKVWEAKDSPAELDGIGLELVGWYAYYQSKMIPLELQEAKFWEEVKEWKSEKPKSDAIVRALWKCTPEGKQMIEIVVVLKTIEKLMSMTKSSVNRHIVEMKNLDK